MTFANPCPFSAKKSKRQDVSIGSLDQPEAVQPSGGWNW